MFKHNLLITLRSFKKYKSSFLINLIGLSIGLTSVLMIYLWVNEEVKMDRFFEKEEQLYVVLENYPTAEGLVTVNSTPSQLARALKEEIPEIEYASSVLSPNWFGVKEGIITEGNTKMKAISQLAESDYFNIFSWNILQGNKAELLTDKYAVVVSNELANKLFGTTKNVIGATIDWAHEDFEGQFQITGIFEKPSKYSSLQFDAVFNYQFFYENSNDDFKSWGNSNPETYLLTKAGTDITVLNQKIKNFHRDKFKEFNGTEWLETVPTMFLQRYSDQYLYNQFENGQQSGGRITYVRLFTLIGLFILLLASINFMNLSTAKAAQRRSEIGIKKAIGASQNSIISQFLGESILLTFFALGIALFLVTWFLPEFNLIIGKQIEWQFSSELILAILGITLATGLLSGSYPALYLSRFRPLHLLQSKMNKATGGLWVRKGLVIFQFSISIFLIIAVLVVYQQMNFIQQKNLGFNKDNIITFSNDGKLGENPATFLQELKKIPGVVETSTFWQSIVGDYGTTSGVNWEGKNQDKKVLFGNMNIDYNWFELLDLEMLEGRSYSKDFGEESDKIIFNEKAIKTMGLENPVGQTIELWGTNRQIIGVVKDFHIGSFYEEIKPCFIQFRPNNSNSIVRIKAGAEQETLQQIEKAYKDYNGGLPLIYNFLDEDYATLYASEQRVATLSQYFSAIAILISCLGLFGLATFTAAQRQKEISIRKVLGASVGNLWQLLSKDFVWLVVISALIAMPLGYVLMSDWLAQFAYRTDLNWWIFAITGLGTLLIALLTVSFQAIRAALMNPSGILKGE